MKFRVLAASQREKSNAFHRAYRERTTGLSKNRPGNPSCPCGTSIRRGSGNCSDQRGSTEPHLGSDSADTCRSVALAGRNCPVRERFFVSVIPSSEVAVNPTRQRAPGLLRMALELRMPLEFAASVAALPFLMSGPRGDGHTVLVIPGLAASDVSTRPLRLYLRGLGYDSQKWNLGQNLGPRPGVLEGCKDLLDQLHRALYRLLNNDDKDNGKWDDLRTPPPVPRS